MRGYVNTNASQKTYYNAGGSFEARNGSTAGISNIRGVVGQAYHNATSGTVDAAYGSEGIARGRTGATSGTIGNARGGTFAVYPYNTNISNGYGVFGYAATNNGYSGNLSNAYGVFGDVNHDSDDGATLSNAYAGYFRTRKRGSAQILARLMRFMPMHLGAVLIMVSIVRLAVTILPIELALESLIQPVLFIWRGAICGWNLMTVLEGVTG